MGQKLFILDNFNDIGQNIAFLPPDLRQKSLSRKLHWITNFCFWIFVMPNIVVNIGEKIGDGMVLGAKLNGNLLNFVDQTVLFLFERRKDSTNFPIHCFSMIDILAGDMFFFLNTRFKQFSFLNLFFTAFCALHLQPVQIKKRIS